MARMLLFSLLGLLCVASLGQAKSFPSAIEDPNSLLSDDYNDGDKSAALDAMLEVVDEALDNMNDDEVDDLVEDYVEKLTGDTDTEVKDVDEPTDFPLDEMDAEELDELMTVEDEVFERIVDLHVAKELLKENQAVTAPANGRRKRIAPLIGRAAFVVGRALFRKFARTGVTRSGSRLTQHYRGSGNYQSALRDFQRMRPSNVRDFNGKISGRTGTVGNYRVTVRDGSTKGVSRPTMSVQREGAKDYVRKFRYDNP